MQIQHLNPAGLRVNPAFTNVIVATGAAKRIIVGAVDPVNEAGELVGPNDMVAQTEPEAILLRQKPTSAFSLSVAQSRMFGSRGLKVGGKLFPG